jgi:hypothetical protein
VSTAATPPAAEPQPDSFSGQARPGRAGPMDAAKAPVGSGAITMVGLVLGLLVTAAGLVAIRDSLVHSGLLGGPPWTEQAAGALNGLTAAGWMVPAGSALVLLGLWLLLTTLRPRRRTGIPVTSSTGVFLRHTDVARLAQRAAEQVDGVLTARAHATRRAVTLRVRSTGSSEAAEGVRSAVSGRLSALESSPTVKVHVEKRAR